MKIEPVMSIPTFLIADVIGSNKEDKEILSPAQRNQSTVSNTERKNGIILT